MYYSGLYKTLRDLEEKKFYDIALLFLTIKGYPNLEIIDGTGDGGRDVRSSWDHIRIQLSVRKDWEKKINHEALLTSSTNSKHFIYVTNRRIKDHERDKFLQEEFKYKGQIEITIFDIASISTSLALPGSINSVNTILGLPITGKIEATPKEIAISNTLLFSHEARELKDEIIENCIFANIFSEEGISESLLSERISNDLGNKALNVQVVKAISRLQSKGNIRHFEGGFTLSPEVSGRLKLSRDDFEQAKLKDLNELMRDFNLEKIDAELLIKISLEILSRKQLFNGDEPYSVQLQEFIATHSLQKRRTSLYEALSRLTTARITAYGDAISHLLSTNTYDIFRSLGRSHSIKVILDSSVAMPMLFGLSFSKVKSRYGIGASAISEMCHAHKFKLVVPRPYLNEMASHGLKALEYAHIYNIIGDESRTILKSSGNAYLSHFGHIRDDKLPGYEMSINDFLSYFGIVKGSSLAKIERRIEQLLNSLEIEVTTMPRWKPELRSAIVELKQQEVPIIIDHDASVLTMLSDSTEDGYIFATWDKILTELVELKSRVYADTPSRVVDFLSMASGSEFEMEQTVSLLDSLVYCDEKKAEALAKKIEAIKSSETAFSLQKFTDEARKKSSQLVESLDIVGEFFSESN
ncbi:TPA: hypothetical protein JAN03_01395 [Citrobacter freundii]|uniref:hypothetical protein n=1 Tax=Citrobacter freundii complex sp. CFNIH2 TaxID=2066049 RepID=UPI000C869044|nr:hypothetical protein [Citrobacter freundii complex sp. CFNIH2]AUO65393.1 hypothetical protein WM46_11820 [Citrobacter freundii complex sp. CFNIH2]HAT6800684.1 hypothetical protein [Citrobacter freundii]